MKASELLISAKKLIENEGSWTQGAYARGNDGITTSLSDPSACQFCSLGALCRASWELSQGLDVDAIKIIQKVAQSANNLLRCAFDSEIASFNDNNSHVEVMKGWVRAIERAKHHESLVGDELIIWRE